MTGKTAEFYRMALVTTRSQRDRLKYLSFGKKAGADRRKELLHSPMVPGNGPLVVWVVAGVNHGGI